MRIQRTRQYPQKLCKGLLESRKTIHQNTLQKLIIHYHLHRKWVYNRDSQIVC